MAVPEAFSADDTRTKEQRSYSASRRADRPWRCYRPNHPAGNTASRWIPLLLCLCLCLGLGLVLGLEFVLEFLLEFGFGQSDREP